MDRHACRTYLAVWFDFDFEKNRQLIKEYGRRECPPEELGITNMREVGEELSAVCHDLKWERHHYICGFNDNYNVDINEMLRVTLKDFFGKEEFLKGLCKKYGVEITLEAVPEIIAESDEPRQILSIDNDIIAFLYKSGADFDMDYYIY